MNSRPTVLVTGASRGLGRATAVAFAGHGFDVGVNFHSHDAEANETVALLKKKNANALLLKADIRSSSSVQSMFDQLDKEWGRLDVLINNAGIVHNKKIASMSDEDWNDVLDTNLTATFYCSRSALALMRPRKEGSIVNIASFLVQRGSIGAANYSVSKSGVISLTKGIALEEGKFQIRANTVMPGFHVTDMNRDTWIKFEKEIRASHLLPNLPSLEEAAEFIYSISQLKSVTGQTFAFESRLL